MAERASVRGVEVKIRSILGVFVLAIVTLGIYYFVWYYKVNRELRDFGASFGSPNPIPVRPAVALLAITVGWLVLVPPFVSTWRTFGRIAKAQGLAGIDDRIEPLLGFVLYVIGLFFLPIETIYAQDHLNRLWRHELRRAA